MVSRQEVADYFGVSLSTVIRWIKLGHLVDGPKLGRQKTVTKESFEALKTDDIFLQSLEKNKEGAPANLSSRIDELERTVEKLDGSVRELLRIVMNNKLAISDLIKAGASVVNNNSVSGTVDNNSETVANKTKQVKTNADKKAFIRQCVEAGVYISDICPEGRGSALGKWLRDETYPLQKNIELWYSNAVSIWEERNENRRAN